MFTAGRFRVLCCAIACALPGCGDDGDEPASERQATTAEDSTASTATGQDRAPQEGRSEKRPTGGQKGKAESSGEPSVTTSPTKPGETSRSRETDKPRAKPGEPAPRPPVVCRKVIEREVGGKKEVIRREGCRRVSQTPVLKEGEK